ncbi:PAC2 family protein [uncultured archaeon]|nr:PAC2 family protein [uncultured archaeon]
MKVAEELKPYGIQFGEAKGSIIGAAGLLLGIGKLRGMTGACLMGETHGGYVDAKSAQAVLEVLSKILDFKIDTKKLELRAKESEKFMKRIEKEAAKQKQVQEGALAGKEVTYIR